MDIQASDNELQKAIDDITNNSVGATPGASELEAQIQSQMGVPPVPPVPEATTAPVMPDATVVPPAPVSEDPVVPDMAAVVPEAPVAEPTVPVPETTATEEAPAINPEPVATPEVAPEPVESAETMETVRGAIVRDLYPLLDEVEAPAEEKFSIIKEMMEETGDKSMIVKGYDAAKGIVDEKAKAEALLYLFENA